MFLPSDLKKWLPLDSIGDENCLYNCVSVSLVGDEFLLALLVEAAWPSAEFDIGR